MQCVGIHNPNLACLLLDAGADIHNAKNGVGQFPGWQIIHWAACCDNKPLLHLLINRGADINSKTEIGHTPLEIAEQYGRKEATAYLASLGS